MALSLINPKNQQGLRFLFDLSDPQVNPERIDMTAIQPVVDMNFGGFARVNDYSNPVQCEKLDLSLAAVQTKTVRILSYGNTSGLDTQAVYPVSMSCVCWGMKFHIYFDTAGATAHNTDYVSIELKLKTPAGIDIVKYASTFHVSTRCQLYSPGHYELPPFTRNNLCVIPPGCALELTTWLQDGTKTFANNTQLRYAFFGTAYPVGAPLPIGI